MPIKILAVDDREANLIALQGALAGTGYEVILALSGFKALELAQEHDFAAILLDVQMPEIDGFETARRLRLDQKTQTTPIVFVTAIHRSEEYEKLGYIAGAVDYIFKPLNIDILKAKLSIFAELYSRNQESQQQVKLLQEAALREKENHTLKEALRSRDEFLSMAAHELKTPITPLNLQLQAFIQMYRDGSVAKVPVEKLLHLLETSQEQVDRLSRLVNELVDVSRIKVGKLEILRDRMDLNLLIQKTVDSFREQSRLAGCEIEFTSGPPIIGNWDYFRLEQVLVNLLANSFKYANGKPIQLRAAQDGAMALFSIQDQGIGIAPEDHNRIFDRFERAVSSRNYAGLGLGLFIASRIVSLHQGEILVESQLGQGAVFTVRLPIDVRATSSVHS
jgi:signal transduction histidine kinase